MWGTVFQWLECSTDDRKVVILNSTLALLRNLGKFVCPKSHVFFRSDIINHIFGVGLYMTDRVKDPTQAGGM